MSMERISLYTWVWMTKQLITVYIILISYQDKRPYDPFNSILELTTNNFNILSPISIYQDIPLSE